jgi:hypothetical protein
MMPNARNDNLNNENANDQGMLGAAEQVRRQAESMLRYLNLYEASVIDLIHGWTARRQGAADEILEALKAMSTEQDPKNMTKGCGALLVAGIGRLGADAFDTWLEAALMVVRNLRVVQRDIGVQAQAMSQDAGFDFSRPSKESVVQGIRDALAIREPVGYKGFLAVDIAHSNESVIGRDDQNGGVAQLHHGGMFELHVQFAPDRSTIGVPGRGLVKAINVGGDDKGSGEVPFRLFIDYGLIDLQPGERILMVPRGAPSAIEKFTFFVPPLDQTSSLPETDTNGEKGELSSNGVQHRPEICVSVYQYTRYIDSAVLPILMQP